MNRRLLSTTVSLSTLLALGAMAAIAPTPSALASPADASAASARALVALLPGQEVDADAAFNAGVTDLNAGNYDSAITHFTTALKLRKGTFSDASFDRGIAYEGKSDWKSAIADFTKVIAARPKFYDVYVERGRAYSASGDFADAVKDLQEAQQIHADRGDAYQVLGVAYFNNKQYDEAVAAYTKYLTLTPAPKTPEDTLTYGDAYNNRGLANYAAKHYAAAIADFKKYIALNPKGSGEVALALADSYLQLKQYPEAVAAYTSYITAHPEDRTGNALGGRALAELQAGQYKESAADYKAFLVLKPDDKAAHVNYLVALKKSGGTLSIQAIKEALLHDPNNLGLLTQLAQAEFAAKDYPSAIAVFDKIITAKPDDYADIFNRALAEENSGGTDKAIADYTTVSKGQPTNAINWNYLGVALGVKGDYKGAIDALTRYIALKPDDMEAYKNRGYAEFNAKDMKAAAADLAKYNTAKPGDAQVGTLLGQARIANGDSAGAIADLEKQVTLHPNDDVSLVNLGVLYGDNKQYDKAISNYTKALAVKKSPQTLFNRGLAYYNQGNFAKAAADAGEAYTAKPDYQQALRLKADSELGAKDTAAATRDYNLYLKMTGLPADEASYASTQLVKISADKKDYAGLIMAVTERMKTDPNNAGNYLLLGQAYIQNKQPADAIEPLTKYTTMKADDSAGFFALGAAYDANKDNAKAVAAYEQALKVKPDYPDAANHAALSYLALANAGGDTAPANYDKAVTYFDKAATLGTGKNSAEALFNEAQALEAKSKAMDNNLEPLKAAVTVWGRYIAAAPNDPEIGKIKAHVEGLKKQIAEG